jgi:hypothetical protein
MGILAVGADERVVDVKFTRDSMSMALTDGRTIIVPLARYPRLFKATAAQRKNWQVAGGAFGIHWTDIDEDLSKARPVGRNPNMTWLLVDHTYLAVLEAGDHARQCVGSNGGTRQPRT